MSYCLKNMRKKIITILILVFIPLITFANDNSVKTRVLPDSPWYSFEKIGENVKTALVFDREKKIERFINLSDERLVEAKEMLNKSKPQIVGKVIGSCEKLLQKATNIIKKIEDEEQKKELLDKIKIKLEEKNQLKKELLENLKPELGDDSELNLPKNLLTTTDTTTPEYEPLPQYPIEEYEKQPKPLDINNKQDKAVLEHSTLQDDWQDKTYNENQLELTDTSTHSFTPQPRENWQNQKDEPQAMLAPTNNGGKPGMEDGHGQVARPDTIGNNTCTKLYLCKIECGSNIIEKCNSYSSPKLYDLLSCRGNCVGYQLFYGCSMEAGCDEPCWDTYNNTCSPAKYQSCLTSCENQFEDC